MVLTEMSILHHMSIVLLVIWLLSYLDRSHPVVYLISLIYLYLIHERYVMRLRRKLQYEERKQANQKRVLTDSETVRWLNYAVEKIWPICMEQIASQKILLPIIPWFLEKYKPWSAKKAVVQHLYLGRNPPVFTEMRVLRHSTDDDHLVLQLGMNFLTAEDMIAILAVKLRKRLGFGMWTKMHLTGMHIEGKVLVGVKFLRHWPFLGRLRVCFAEPPYFQMTVKPIFTHGLDVTEFPGIAGWLDKLLSVAFEETLVEPNMLVVDMEKFVSPKSEPWFSVDVKEPVAYAKVEVIEASDMKPSDLNGLADPYVKGQLGPYRFKTRIQRKTLTPKWQEEFKIPICTWESPNVLTIEVCDKDHFVDDTLGDCSINITELRDNQRHDMWLPLKNIKMGRLHLAITVLEKNEKEIDIALDKGTSKMEDMKQSFATETVNKSSFSSSLASPTAPKDTDTFEPIDIKGQKETGIWVQHPGTDISQSWQPRKRSRRLDTEIQGDSATGNDENGSGKNPINKVQRGLKKIGSVFHRNSKRDDYSGSIKEDLPSPRVNLRAINRKESGVNFIVDDSLSGPSSGEIPREDGSPSSERSGSDSPHKVKHMAKSILKHAGNSARRIKHALSKKGSKGSGTNSFDTGDIDTITESESTESLSSPGVEILSADNEFCDAKELAVDTDVTKNEAPTDSKGPSHSVNPERLEGIYNETNRPDSPVDISAEPEVTAESKFIDGNTKSGKDEVLNSTS